MASVSVIGVLMTPGFECPEVAEAAADLTLEPVHRQFGIDQHRAAGGIASEQRSLRTFQYLHAWRCRRTRCSCHADASSARPRSRRRPTDPGLRAIPTAVARAPCIRARRCRRASGEICRLGATKRSSSTRWIAAFSRASPLTLVMATGTRWLLSSRRRAVTVTSSIRGRARLPAPRVGCAQGRGQQQAGACARQACQTTDNRLHRSSLSSHRFPGRSAGYCQSCSRFYFVNGGRKVEPVASVACSAISSQAAGRRGTI